MNDLMQRLSAPFPPDVVTWRIGSTNKEKTKGMALAYIDARDVMGRLDEVMGPHWQCKYVPMPNGTYCCELGLLIEGDWLWRSNGAGATDVEGEKGGYSDALKRAAVLWGVGRYLYDLPAPWVEIEGTDRFKHIAKHEYTRLRALLPGAQPRKSARESRSSDDWKKLAENLGNCRTTASVDEYLSEHADMISQMPEGWTNHWSEHVRTIRQAIVQAQTQEESVS